MLAWTSLFIVLSAGCGHCEAQAIPQPLHEGQKLRTILKYISSAWSTLTRSTTDCEAVADSKLQKAYVLYFPADMPIPATLGHTAGNCRIHASHLPFTIHGPGEVKAQQVQPPGLLFLENRYVVPGGRFNEMYGWDSYFIIRGLLRAGKVDLARGMVENFFFEIEHYGSVLNANRSYYLTRSQPPFLSSMILAVYDADKARGRDDREWLAKAYGYADRDYQMWTRDPHLAGTTSLSRYYDFSDGPVPEGLHDEAGYYHDVLAYFLRQSQPNPYVLEAPSAESLPHPEYRVELCDAGNSHGGRNCGLIKYATLSPEYYKGDRSMRESGFDITFRFGPYGADADHFAPVCLNSLLYKTETDMEKMAEWLGNRQAVTQWRERSEKRKQIIQTLLWNPQAGMFFDYEFQKKKLSSYDYLTTFYPLWAGIATDAQARAVVNNLKVFEHEGGLAMSTQDTGVQWDYPYGWAPMQLIAVEGLRRYGYNEDANRISYKFLSMVLANFERDGNIREKYKVVTDSSNVKIAEGYRSNIIGFGWTNAVFLELLSQLPQTWVNRMTGEKAPRSHP
ncbi:MAG: trehalase family glycosidase [Terriglobales bacterium]